MLSSTNETTNECRRQMSLRRFPENNSLQNPQNNSSKIPEMPYRSRNSRDNEHGDRKIESLLSASLMNSQNNHSTDSDSSPRTIFYNRNLSDSPQFTSQEDASFNHLIYYMSSQTKTLTKSFNQVSTTEPKSSQGFSELQNKGTIQSRKSFIQSVLQNGDYLLKYSSWHAFRGTEEVQKCSNKVIERNENIWELVSIEYKYFNRLVDFRNVYCKQYPYLETGTIQMANIQNSSTARSDSVESNKTLSISDTKEKTNNVFESIDALLPGIDDIIECHAKMCNCLINNHLIRPDRVITEIGRVLHESIPDDFIPTLSELYGRINYTLQHIDQKLSQFKKYPMFSSYIHKCERDTRCEKKTLKDLLLEMSVYLSKKVPTLNSIISNTINDSHDLNNLLKFKEKIDKILNEASAFMEKQTNSIFLKNLVENYEISPELEESQLVFGFMTSGNAKLIYNGKIKFELKKSSNGKFITKEVHGVALEDCIFFLQIINEPGKATPKYQLFEDHDSDFPAFLEWGQLYGYFREEDSKNSDAFSFYVIIEKPKPSIKRFLVETPQDRSNWKKCMIQGFSRWQSETSHFKDADNQLQEEMSQIDKKWANTKFGIDLIKSLDNSLRIQLEYRTVGFRCILEEELKRLTAGSNMVKQNSSNSIDTVTENTSNKDELDNSVCFDTYLPNLTTREGIHDWLEMFMEWVNRLKFSLSSSGANITRSASEIEARKRRSIPMVKKYDTFTSCGSPSYGLEKQQTELNIDNPPIAKQKKDQRRISVTGITNFFRTNNKTAKVDDNDKSNGRSNTNTNLECEMDNMTLSNSEIVSETDCFLLGLSKNTVAIFNEINIAAKNITIELLNLRTENMAQAAELKKNQEENQSFKEFIRKYKKSTGDGQSGLLLGNNNQNKNDSINNSLGITGLTPTGGSDILSDGMESVNELSSGFGHPDQKMVECRRETENLRQMYAQFAKDKKNWEKEYETQRRKIENDKENMFQKNMELKKEKENLIEREKKYKDSCLNLQKKIDMYFETYGIHLDEEPHDGVVGTENTQRPCSKETIAPFGLGSPPLAYTEATLYNSDPSEHKTTESFIPDQCRGSLINQSSVNNQYMFLNSYSQKNSGRHTVKTNSSDNTLETRGNTPCTSGLETQMTPLTKYKDKPSGCSSDVEEINTILKKPNNLGTKSMSTADNNKLENRSSYINHTKSDISDSRSSVLGIPLSLADKSKVKKEKSKRFKLI